MEDGPAGSEVGDGSCGADDRGIYTMGTSLNPTFEGVPRGVSTTAVQHHYEDGTSNYNCTTGFCEIFSQKIYATYWARVTYTTEALSRNFKLFNGTGASHPYGDPSHPQFRWDVYPQNGAGHLYTDTTSECGSIQVQDWAAGDPFQGEHQGQWMRIERYSDDDDGGPNGQVYLWVDGVLTAELQGQVTGGGSSCSTHWGNIRILSYFAKDPLTVDTCPSGSCDHPGEVRRCTTNDHYYICRDGQWVDIGTTRPSVGADVFSDDYYLDTTPARVEVCEGSTWAQRGTCEVQIPSAWSDVDIQVRVNRGGFGTTDSAFLYVVNDGNEANEAGLPLSFAD